MARAEGKAGHRGGGVFAETRQAPQSCGVAWDPAAVLLEDPPGRAAQVAGPRVIAEPRPRREHAVLAGAGEGREIREAGEERFVPAADGGDRRLLQHDLGNPDAVGVARPAPGKPPLLSAGPVEEPPKNRVGLLLHFFILSATGAKNLLLLPPTFQERILRFAQDETGALFP